MSVQVLVYHNITHSPAPAESFPILFGPKTTNIALNTEYKQIHTKSLEFNYSLVMRAHYKASVNERYKALPTLLIINQTLGSIE